MNDYTQYRGPLLLAVGGLLQWLRAFQGISDKFSIPLGVALAILTYLLTRDYSAWAVDPQLFVITTLLGVAEAIGTLFGSTFLVAKAANNASEAQKENILIPATDSK